MSDKHQSGKKRKADEESEGSDEVEVIETPGKRGPKKGKQTRYWVQKGVNEGDPIPQNAIPVKGNRDPNAVGGGKGGGGGGVAKMLHFLLAVCAEETLNRDDKEKKENALNVISTILKIYNAVRESDELDEGVMQHVVNQVQRIIADKSPLAFDLVHYNLSEYALEPEDEEEAAPPAPAAKPPTKPVTKKE